MFEWFLKWFEPSVLANIIVAGAAIWYTIETQRLRRTAVKQLTLMRQSMSSGLLPYVLAGIHKKSSFTDDGAKKVDSQLSEWLVRRVNLPVLDPPKSYGYTTTEEVLQVTSTTDEVASHVFCVLFDDRSKDFRIAPYQLEVVAPRESGYFPIASGRFSADEVFKIVAGLYEARSQYLDKFIRAMPSRGESILLPIFFDLAGRLYATPRPVYWATDGTATYGKSDLLQPDGYSEDFAPTFESTKAKMA